MNGVACLPDGYCIEPGDLARAAGSRERTCGTVTS